MRAPNIDAAAATELFENAASCAHALLEKQLHRSQVGMVIDALHRSRDAMRELGDHWRDELPGLALKYRDRELEALKLIDSLHRLERLGS